MDRFTGRVMVSGVSQWELTVLSKRWQFHQSQIQGRWISSSLAQTSGPSPVPSRTLPQHPSSGMLLQAGGQSLLDSQGLHSSCSRPFSAAFLRGGQVTASFPSPLLAMRLGAGSLNSAVP